jgi:hypothetical protein
MLDTADVDVYFTIVDSKSGSVFFIKNVFTFMIYSSTYGVHLRPFCLSFKALNISG